MLSFKRDERGEPGRVEQALIGVVIMVVIAAVLYVALLAGYISDLTNETSENYVGDNLSGIVGIVPIFYWLAVALSTVGVALVTFRGRLK